MATELLVTDWIDDGHNLLVELVRAGFDVTVAAWVRAVDQRQWRLFIGSASVEPKTLGDAFRTVLACLQRTPGTVVNFLHLQLCSAADPITTDLLAVRDRLPGRPRADQDGDIRIGPVLADGLYVYPRITPGLTRDEVFRRISDLVGSTDAGRPSTLTLRDGTAVHGIPYGIERTWRAGRPAALEIKVLDDTDGSTRVIPADEVANIL